MTESKKPGMMNVSLYHFLTLILQNMYTFLNLKKLVFDSLVVPPDGRVICGAKTSRHWAITSLVASLPSDSSSDS